MYAIKTMENVSHVKRQNDTLPSLGLAKAVLRRCNPPDQLYCSLKHGEVYI